MKKFLVWIYSLLKSLWNSLFLYLRWEWTIESAHFLPDTSSYISLSYLLSLSLNDEVCFSVYSLLYSSSAFYCSSCSCEYLTQLCYIRCDIGVWVKVFKLRPKHIVSQWYFIFSLFLNILHNLVIPSVLFFEHLNNKLMVFCFL